MTNNLAIIKRNKSFFIGSIENFLALWKLMFPVALISVCYKIALETCGLRVKLPPISCVTTHTLV